MATNTTQATTHATTQAHGGSHGGGGTFPPFDGSTMLSQLLWFAIAFGALYWLMSKVVLPRVASILEERETRVATDLDAAAKLKGDTDQAIAAYEKALADAKAKAQAIATETRDRLQGETDARRKAIEADLAVKLEAAEAQITASKAQAMTNVRGIAVDAAQAIVQQLVGTAPSVADVEAAVARTLDPAARGA
jgi:F-type H+-transporting ATPase subunit b